MDQRLCGNSVQPGFGAARLHRAFRTRLRKNIAEIDLAANQGESGEAAARKAEEAYAVAIDLRRAGPSAKHEIDQELDVGRAIGQRRRGILVVVFGRVAAVASRPRQLIRNL